MNKQTILNELVKTKFVDSYCKKKLVNRQVDLDEAIQYCWLIICELEEEKLIQWYNEGGINKIRQLASGIIHRQLVSKNSPFYNQYIKKNTKNIIKRRTNDSKQQQWNEVEGWQDSNDDTNVTEDSYNDLKEEFELKKDNEFIHTFKQLNELEQSILLTYIENKTYTATAKKLNISTPVLRRVIEKIRNNFKKIYKELYGDN
jgi:heat shock protein HspQ